MPKDLKDFPRPPNDNGRGLHGSAAVGWSGGNEGYDYWVNELVAMGVKWFKVLDDRGDSILMCERLLGAGIFPIVRILRKDPPPNDTPEPNPGHIGPPEEETIQRLIALGVRYFETNNEPNLSSQWKHNAMTSDPVETAKLVALNWLFDARVILEAGGLPALPAASIGSQMDLIGALVALGRQEILLEGCWIALHNYCLNHPLAYPDDPVNQSGQLLTPQQYDSGPLTPWAWWNSNQGCPDSIEFVNAERARTKNPGQTILEDHACFREFEYYDHLATKYLGRSIPVISTEGGFLVGRRADPRYPRVTPDMHRDQTVAMYDFMQRQAPDYYFAATPSLLLESAGLETDAWNSAFWSKTLKNGAEGKEDIPPIAVQGIEFDRLPVMQAVKAMPSIARRLPGGQPLSPISQSATASQPLVQVAQRTESLMLRYEVVAGDSLTKIARQFGISYTVIAEVNQIANPSFIRPGQILFIPQTRPGAAPNQRVEQPRTAVGQETKPTHTAVSDEFHPRPSLSAEPKPSQPSHPAAPPAPPPTVVPPSTEVPPAWATSQVQEDAAPPNSSPAFKFEPPRLSFSPSEPASSPPAAPMPASPPPALQPRPPSPAKQTPPASPAVSPSLLFSSAPVPLLDWDPRLDALRVGMEPANVPSGQLFWKLIRAEYLGPSESDGKHHIYYAVEDEQGQPVEYQRVWQGWPDDKTDATTNEKGQANIPLWASFAPDHDEMGPYSAWVDGLPSDRVRGLGLPQKRHVSFVLAWRRVIA